MQTRPVAQKAMIQEMSAGTMRDGVQMICADDALIPQRIGRKWRPDQANGEQMTPSERRFDFNKPSYTRTRGLDGCALSPTASSDGTGLEGRRGW